MPSIPPTVRPVAMATSTILAVVAVLLLTLAGAPTAAAQDFAGERRRMVEEITALVRETRAEVGMQAFDERVMTVMARVPRHEFVPADQLAFAYRKMMCRFPSKVCNHATLGRTSNPFLDE